MRLVVGAALVDDLHRPGRLLAARRSAPAALAGRWELPGGKVEAGEAPEAALHRELHEELGVRVELGGEVTGPVGGAWPLGGDLVMRVWWTRLLAGDPAPLQDHDELRWLPLGRWASVEWLPGDVPLVGAMQRLAAPPPRAR
ncbi:(deoxy)nucleoside triphosphate pyrophosphohydrolase [Kineococcus esterisolvens]|uniref:(deoxy)nucleoside triphosphate pyrophosphohydrolase n=1 Tax=unclassified Kineococcus TaxID=2621656 RepID=UPI003D7CE4E3